MPSVNIDLEDDDDDDVVDEFLEVREDNNEDPKEILKMSGKDIKRNDEDKRFLQKTGRRKPDV